MFRRVSSRKVQRDRTQRLHLPAPIGGINTVSAGVNIPATDSILSFNVIGAEYGLRSRLGWREWVTGLDGQVRSILAFQTNDGTSKRFACTYTGIWDVTASTSTPTRVVTFPAQDQDSGWGAHTSMVTVAGHFLCYWDESNGYYLYTAATDTWTAGGPSGTPVVAAAGSTPATVDPADLVFGMSWKNRLWMVEKDTARAWYLDLNAVGGDAVPFNFGARFKAGGELRCLASWTHGGDSIDDELVAVSGGGDVVIYKGTDPSSASTFGLSGFWSAGGVPAGRRLCTDNGGELLLMSSTGILPTSKLVTGGAAYTSQYETSKISNLFSQFQSNTRNLRGWSMRLHPADGALMVLVPTAVNQATQQLVMSLSTKGWHQYRELPIGVCAEPSDGTLFFGTEDGRVCVNDGYVDGITLADPTGYTAIPWSILTGYANLGDPRQKQVQLIRPTILTQGGAVAVRAQARYRWDLSESASPDALAAAAGDTWDSGLWDSAMWAGDYQADQQVFGADGIGPEVAIAIRGTSTSRMTITGIDVEFDVGGTL